MLASLVEYVRNCPTQFPVPLGQQPHVKIMTSLKAVMETVAVEVL